MASLGSPSITMSVGRSSWRPWSDLPEELLRLVMEWLSGGDRIRFRAVCKNWGFSTIQNDNIPKLPWIMYHSFLPESSTWSFFEPSGQLPHIMEDKGWSESKWRPRSPFICDSRFGWVLLAERISSCCSESNSFCPYPIDHNHRHYIYHPLYKKIISIPTPEFMQGKKSQNCKFGQLAAFSSCNPSSPDCAFIVSSASWGMHYFFISTYSVSDQTWKTYRSHPHPYFYHIDGLAYMEGSVYCYNGKQGLSSFHIATEEWRSLSNQNTLIMLSDFEHMDFVAYDGNVHLVYLLRSARVVPLCSILKYDWSDGAWKKMQSLEGGAIFFGKPSFGIPAAKQTRVIANRVYYFSINGPSPKFLVYGEEEEEEEEEESELSLPRDKIYWETVTTFDDISYYTWMDPPPF